MSTRKVVNLKDFAKELGNFAKLSLEKKRSAVAKGLARSIPDLVAASPVDTGMYAASWNFTVGETSAIIGNTAPYAGIIEYGARPFTPPIAPLLAWAKRVLGDGSQPGDYSSRVWALAKYTQNKITANGMRPRHILEDMLPTIIENIKEEMQKIA